MMKNLRFFFLFFYRFGKEARQRKNDILSSHPLLTFLHVKKNESLFIFFNCPLPKYSLEGF